MPQPETIGPYRVERLLGVGSFATVWLGYDPALDGRVAIKVLAENWSHDLRVRERFQDECRLLWRLDHERLARVHAVGELADGRPYAVLAWADAGSLRDRLAAGPLPAPYARWLLREIAAGVAVLHEHAIVHRDLTPGNVLFRTRPDGGEQVLVADLGLAKALAAASGLTARAGTPGYMAPEQDHPLATVDTRADVYGLGRLGAELLGGQVPAAVATVLSTASAPEPGDRYPDAAAFLAALDAAEAPAGAPGTAAGAAAVPAAPAEPAAGRRVRRRRVLALAGGLAVAVLGGAGVAGWQWRARAGDPGTARRGPLHVTLPAGWRAAGSGWSGQHGADGQLDPAVVISPDPDRWAADPAMPGAFVGLSAGLAEATTAAAFVADRTHAGCDAADVRTIRQAGVDWVVAAFTGCASGKPELVEAAGLAPAAAGLLYVQLAPPAGSGPEFVDTLLAGVRVRP